jgi:phage gp37-like protein
MDELIRVVTPILTSQLSVLTAYVSIEGELENHNVPRMCVEHTVYVTPSLLNSKEAIWRTMDTLVGNLQKSIHNIKTTNYKMHVTEMSLDNEPPFRMRFVVYVRPATFTYRDWYEKDIDTEFVMEVVLTPRDDDEESDDVYDATKELLSYVRRT